MRHYHHHYHNHHDHRQNHRHHHHDHRHQVGEEDDAVEEVILPGVDWESVCYQVKHDNDDDDDNDNEDDDIRSSIANIQISGPAASLASTLKNIWTHRANIQI